MNGTFERKTITVPFYPEVLRIGRQTNNKTIPTPLNGYFDSKVLSRQHAEVWADRSGKIWIRDVKSSNGTFVNGQRLSQENRDSDPHELREQDMLELGIDIVSEDQKSIVHHKVAARVEHAGIYANLGTSVMDLNFSELENQQVPNVMGSANQQQIQNMRGRTPSQGSINSGRLQGAMGATANGAAMQQPRHPNFWLQPITMEQVVKKLNVSYYKCA
jgi:pSer/pThr/pTyr-binding forkhead associated (FHA) protein